MRWVKHGGESATSSAKPAGFPGRSSTPRVGSGSPASMTAWGTVSDAGLMAAVARWKEPALEEAYRRHGGAVYALARRLLGPGGQADDVTQDVFVDLWDHPERFDPARGSLRAFLVTITHGRAVDVLRSDRARHGREERTAHDGAAAAYDLEELVCGLAVSDQVQAAVGALPAAERRVIALAYFGGHTYREVAALLGEPEGTIKGRIRAGLRRLRAALIQQGMEPTWIDP
jgi:RNA polymerase sigma-70 factor (ECF subfamily)